MRFSLRSLLSFVSFFVISLVCVLQAAHADVWMADEQSLHKLDLVGNRIALSLPASKIKQLAVDPKDGSVWALTDKKITKRAATGALSFEAELKTLGRDTTALERMTPPFHRIRYDGLLGHRHRKDTLTRCRQLLGTPAPETLSSASSAPADYRDRDEALTGISLRAAHRLP